MHLQCTPGDIARFWSKVTKDGPVPAHCPELGPCWLWTGYQPDAGYGRFNFQATTCGAHRVAYTLCVGPIPDGLWVLHRCDNPPCVNPAHLFLGTLSENHADMVRKGRQARGLRTGVYAHPESRARGQRNGTHTHPERLHRGSAHWQAKLTEDQVRAIRATYARGDMNQTQLAHAYGVTQALISLIVRREGWAHVQ